MLHETQKDPKVQTQFVRFVQVHYAYPFRGKNSGNKFHQVLGSLLGREPVNLARRCKGIETGGYRLAVLRPDRTAIGGFHLQFHLPIC